MNHSSSDECLVVLAQRGSLEAYNQLFARYHHQVEQLIHFYLKEKANVGDLTQDVLLKVFRHLVYFKRDSQFSTWLNRITQNTIKNYYRSRSLRLDSEARFIEEMHPHYSCSPEQSLINTELSEQIEAAISRLSDELRLCYGMHIIEGQTYEDIAEKMHCPVGTVRSRIFRARKLMIGYVGLNRL